MSNTVAVTKEKVQRYLTDFLGSVSIDRDGDFHVRSGSTMVFLRVVPFGETESVVNIFAPTNRGVPESAELYKYIATRRFYFGSLSAAAKDGAVNVSFQHNLLGEYLDPDELRTALKGVAISADALDDEIKSSFGGVRFHES